MRIGERLRNRRLEQGMSLRQLADQLAVDPAYLSRVERDLAPPSVHLIERLAVALDCPLDELAILAGRIPAESREVLASEAGRAATEIRKLRASLLCEPSVPYGGSSPGGMPTKDHARRPDPSVKSPPDRASLSLFGDGGPMESPEILPTPTAVDLRPIARNPPPPPHRPTAAVPPSLLVHPKADATARQRATTAKIAGQLTSVLGHPYFADEGFFLYRTDCLPAMRELAAAGLNVELTVTSPPYNIGKPYESPRAVDEYLSWSADWIQAVHSITGPRGAFWLNVGYLAVPGRGKAVPIPYLLWGRSDFFLVQEVVWNYGAGITSRRSFAPRNEKWLFYVRNENAYTFNLDEVRDPNVKYPNQKKHGKFRCNPLGKNPSDVWQFPKVTTGENRSSKERTAHPAQFPLGIVERIVRVSSNPGDVVLDPFSGSASAGIAAAATGRVYLGFEIRDDYCRISAERFRRFLALRDEATRQGGLVYSEADDSVSSG